MVGDFNAISSEEKQRGGSFTHYIAQSKNFNDFIFFNCFSIWIFLGSSFTWSNVQGGCARRWARLDRFLAKLNWLRFLFLIMFCISRIFLRIMPPFCLKFVFVLVWKIKFFALKIFGWLTRVVMIKWLKLGVLTLKPLRFIPFPTSLPILKTT